MEFGKLPNVEDVDWSLPGEDPLAVRYLQQSGGLANLSIHYGAPAWGHKEWIGKIYPPKTKPGDFLYHYSRYFNCIELNTTHYRIPTLEQVKKWTAQVPPHFLFCPKMYQGISHERYGLLDAALLRTWLEALQALQPHLGPTFLQLPPHFDYHARADLFHFLQQWPDEWPLALEFRHPSWFLKGRVLPALTEYLQGRRIGLVITDVAGRRDVLHTSISAPFVLLRFIGNNLHPSDYVRATRWCEKFVTWEAYGLEQLFLFIHEPDDVSAPEMTEYFIKELERLGQWQVRPKVSSPLPPQLSLEL